MSLSTAGPAPEPAPGPAAVPAPVPPPRSAAPPAAAGAPGTGPGLLSPVADEDSAPFWEYAARGELRMQSCAGEGCGALRFPPRPCCPHCRSFDSEWRRMSGQGRIWSYVVPHPPLLPAYAALAPYNVVLVELAEDPRIRLAGSLVRTADDPLGTVDPSRIRIGARVRAVFAGAAGAGAQECGTEAAGPVDPRLIPRWTLERP